MNSSKHVCFFFILTLLFISCATENGKTESKNPLETEISFIKSEFAPDKRVALFNVQVEKKGSSYVLKGESDLPKAVAALKEQLSAENLVFADSIQLLPSPELGENIQAVINISVANLRSEPKHSAELATQATLGTPVKVLKKEGGWYYIQTPDKYLSWVDDGGITLMDAKSFEQWQGTDKLIYTNTYGHSYSGEGEEQLVSDLVAGNVLEIIKYGAKHFIVRYPDGRTAFVRINESQKYDEWLESLNPTVDNLVDTSKKFIGVPYLWGGTSTKGMDCSGFTKTIYFLNGMVIPRDASQQVHTGKAIDSVQNFENLQKGDLLFFGRKATDSTAEKVVHVGMWIGNNEFIHASNMVRISSMDQNAENYDNFNRNRYLRTKRILKEEGDALINLTQTPLFKD
jgi:hypothetical protein